MLVDEKLLKELETEDGHILDALFRNCENINMDHKYMFTPTTILKTMFVSGIIPKRIEFLDLYKYSKIFKKSMLGNTIVVVGEIEGRD